MHLWKDCHELCEGLVDGQHILSSGTDFIMFITITACNGTRTGVSFVDLPHILAEAAKYVI